MSIFARLLVSFIALAAIPMIFLGLIMHANTKGSLEKQAYVQLETVARIRAFQLEKIVGSGEAGLTDTDWLSVLAIAQDTTGLGDTGNLQIIKQEGAESLFLIHGDREETPKLEPVYFRRGETSEVVREVFGSRNGFGPSTNEVREPALAAWQYIPTVEWGVVASIDEAEVFGGADKLKYLTLILGVIMMIPIGIMAFAISRSITDPVRRIVVATQAIGAGRFDTRIHVDTGDEVERLAGSINEMAGDLHELTQALTTAKAALQETHDELEIRVEELVRSNAELEQFAYVASHDLQEPLRMVTSYVQLLAERYESKLDEKADKYISYAVDGATRMQHLISDLLTFSRVGKQQKPHTEVPTSEIVDQTLANLEVAIRESRGVVTRADLPTVSADRGQMGQLFGNLIGNGLKFRTDEPPRIHVDAERNGQAWVFSIRDNGIGMDMGFSDRIFRAFQRLHGRGKYPGTGIGLAIAKKIVEQHKGSIWVESEPGNGATFFFTLPYVGTA